ncbi:MAG: 5' nucleotidase, NT5C type [Desulforhopalus sp.]
MTIPIREIGFDFDGVIADTAEAFIRLACTNYGYCSFTLDDITNFELEHCLDMPRDLVESIFTEILYDSIGTDLRPITGAVDCLEKFTTVSPVTIITARTLQKPVLVWLERFFTETARAQIRVVATGDHNDKIRYIRSHNLKYFIDDRAETCRQLAKDNITPFVFTQPWNINRHQLQAVASWEEIRALVT